MTLKDIVRRSVGIVDGGASPRVQPVKQPSGGFNTPNLLGLADLVERAIKPIVQDLEVLKVAMKTPDPRALVMRSAYSSPRTKLAGPRRRGGLVRRTSKAAGLVYKSKPVRGSRNNAGRVNRAYSVRDAVRMRQGLPPVDKLIIRGHEVRDAMRLESQKAAANFGAANSAHPGYMGLTPQGVHDRRLGLTFTSPQAREHYYSGISKDHDGKVIGPWKAVKVGGGPLK